MYRFATLDPRPIPAAHEANEAIFASGPVYGVEITVPVLAARCWFNLDPQHSDGNANYAAIEAALELVANLPHEGDTLATIRADLDSVGAMAVFGLLARGEFLTLAVRDRIGQVAAADKFARGGWPGAQPLPSWENPWPKEAASAESSRELAAIAAAVMDFRVLLADRVATMERWLLTGEEPERYRDQVEQERLEMIAALESGAIKADVRFGGRIAVVESAHRAATLVGYALAPVVVALNPAFRLGGGEPHRKFTVCQFTKDFVDLRSALAKLAELEPGWGGSPTIGGSPQDVSSTLTINQVVEVIERHLK